ncbi:serpin family protein [Haloechinothrix halophila]|uniref:serpin family protein n=1 Tax=Haloechinothrix halophila TaxID=1069073 RepID=UPI0003F787A7|nr:serpin family protein [Haloechinothrix halophila]
MAEITAQREHLRLCLALHRVLAAEGGTTCFSPYSVASALGLVYQAARGSTADELRALLSEDEPDIAKQLELLADAAVLDTGRDGEEPVIAVSNTLWAWDQLRLNDDFGADLAAWPGAKLAHAPFVTDPEGAREAINADVARTTRDLITELVPSGAVTVDTVASLVNALYLKAAWRNPFAVAQTTDGVFHTPGGDRTVPMMRQVEQLGYAEADGWRAAVLPAAGGVQAVVLLPDAAASSAAASGAAPASALATAESSLDADTLSGLLDGVRTRRVSLRLPRVDVGMNVSLNSALGELGVAELFTPDADLTGLSDDPRLLVSDALHESVLKLDEDGLEGAAATAMMIRLTSVSVEEPVSFVVDRPFLLLVRHTTTGAVYFLARVTDPT